jgi:hypothetical protein
LSSSSAIRSLSTIVALPDAAHPRWLGCSQGHDVKLGGLNAKGMSALAATRAPTYRTQCRPPARPRASLNLMDWSCGSPFIPCHVVAIPLSRYWCQSGVTMIDPDLLKDFEWYRDKKGYRLSLDPPMFGMQNGRVVANDGPRNRVIVANGGPSDLIRYRPFAHGGDLCAPFALIKTDKALLRFVNDHGPLTARLLPLSPPNELLAKMQKLLSRGESVDLGLGHANMFADLVRLKSQGDTRKLASYFESDKPLDFSLRDLIGRVELVADANKGLRLKMCPPDLLGAMWYQLGLKLSSLRTCRLCQRVFEVGVGTGRRTDAQFCCREHKVEFFNHSRPRATDNPKENRR